jgi:predicted 3-demethylubiquinone-9 3-methyltransferase (glyoxalase superfamily)
VVPDVVTRITTFLMFEGNADKAIDFYVSVFKDSRITSIERFGPGQPGIEGTVRRATFILSGKVFMAFDSPVKHKFTFTPAISLFVDCDSEAEVAELAAKLAQDGQILMPLDEYPFSRKFAWVADRFGVSWQLHLSST